MTIDGIEPPLALYAPRIDPAALVRAAAAGLSIGEIVFVALDLSRDLPGEWQRLKTTGQAQISISKAHLPWLARARNATISATAFAARATGSPAAVQIKANGAPVTLAAAGGAPIAESAFAGAFAPAIGSVATLEVPSVAMRDALEGLLVVARLDLN